MKIRALSILICIVMPVFYILIPGVLHGAWFGGENFVQRYEYAKENMFLDRQYQGFYIVLIIMSLLELSLICLYLKKSKSNYKYVTSCIAILLWGFISYVFIALTPYGAGFPVAKLLRQNTIHCVSIVNYSAMGLMTATHLPKLKSVVNKKCAIRQSYTVRQ